MITDALIQRIRMTDNPTVVGLDPRISQIPAFLLEKVYETYGKTPSALAEAFWLFNQKLLDALYDVVPAVKPQIAMYEQLGPAGIAAYIKTIAYAKELGLIVIGDIKRGDIASTAEAYADGHIGEVEVSGERFPIYREDYVTLNPYMGWDTIEPYLPYCEKSEKGLFILVKTSNPHSGQLQDLPVEGQPLYAKVGRLVEEWGAGLRGEFGYSAIGAVVGATHPEQAAALRRLMPHTFFLVPGYGAQGGTAEDLSVCFDKEGLGAIVNSSRGITAAFMKPEYASFGPEGFDQAARKAALDMKADLNRVRKRGRL